MFQDENLKSNLVIRDKLLELSRRKECTLTQLALAWLLAQGTQVIPIPGTKHIDHLANNLGALEVHLKDEDLKYIQECVFNGTKVKGLRYPKNLFDLQNIQSAEVVDAPKKMPTPF